MQISQIIPFDLRQNLRYVNNIIWHYTNYASKFSMRIGIFSRKEIWVKKKILSKEGIA